MATSGQVLGNVVSDNERVYLNWQLASQSVAGNYSIINWQIGWVFDGNGCRGLRHGDGSINGSVVYSDYDSGDGVHGFVSGHNHRPALQTASGSIQINHSSNGTKTFSASAGMTGWQGQRSDGSASFALPTIPREPGAPGAPTFQDITATSVEVNWTAPSNVGSGLTQRQVQIATNSNFSNIIKNSTTSWNLVYDATGLPKGTTLYARVRAASSAGFGDWSSVRSFTTLTTVPSAPGTPTFSNVQGTSVQVSWTAPSDNGGAAITGYTLQRSLSASFTSPTTTNLTGTSVQVTGLAHGTEYFFRVRATNSAGTGSFSGTGDVTTGITTPSAPAAPSVGSIGITTASVSWSAPSSNGGSTITGYDIQRARNSGFTQGVQTVASTSSPKTLTGLAVVTDHWVRVRAKNAAGAGPWSTATQFRTKSNVRIGDGDEWIDMRAYAGNGSAWVPYVFRQGSGSGWS